MNLCKVEYNNSVIHNITSVTGSVTLNTTDKVGVTDIKVTSIIPEYDKSVTVSVTEV